LDEEKKLSAKTKFRPDRLLKLADHLEAGRPGGHKKFDFTVIHYNHGDENHCGSVGCALGELPVLFPKSWEFSGEGNYESILFANKNYNFPAAEEFFGITENDVNDLFVPVQKRWWLRGSWLKKNTTAKAVARSIRTYVAARKAGKRRPKGYDSFLDR
jgi:hypothetical protein